MLLSLSILIGTYDTLPLTVKQICVRKYHVYMARFTLSEGA